MSITVPKIIFLAETIFLLILLYVGRNFLRKRIVELFKNTRIPKFYLQGFRLLLGILVLERLYDASYGGVLYIKQSSFFRIDAIYDLFIHPDYKFFLLIFIPIIFTTLFVFEWKPRLTSVVVFLYSVIGGSLFHTIHGSLGQMQHKFHMIALLLLGFAIYYLFFYKSVQSKSQQKNRALNEWIILPIMLFFVATIYGSSFMSKMSYLSEIPKWFTGEAMQSAIIKGHFQRVVTFGYEIDELRTIPQLVINNQHVAVLLGVGGLLIEFSSLLLLIVARKLRLAILFTFLVFNLSSGLLILPSYFVQNILVLLYMIIWAAYNAFPKNK